MVKRIGGRHPDRSDLIERADKSCWYAVLKLMI